MTYPAPAGPVSLGKGGIPRLSWDEFLQRFDWRQGEHVTLIGPTGSGKTTLALALLYLRTYVVVFGTKPRDRTLMSLIRREGYRRIRAWPPGPTRRRVILWPKVVDPDDIPAQAVIFDDALRQIFRSGGWCVFVDEVWYVAKFLGLARLLELFWSQARSLGITLVATTQRPAHVPLAMYSEATHVFLWQMVEMADRKRIREFGGSLNSALIVDTLAVLDKHDCLYLNTRTGQMFITKAPRR